MNYKYQYYVHLPRIIVNYPCLYDREDPHFRNRQLKDELWSHIAKEINHVGSVELLASRWRNIRVRYQRYKKNMETGKSQSMSPLFEHCTFLDPFIVERTPSASTPVTQMNCKKETFNARLIKKVRENPCLYEVRGWNYVSDRKMAWETLKVEMNFKGDADQLVTIWKRLRDKYVKTKAEMQKYPSVRQIWVHFDQMAWLDKNSRSNAPSAAQRIYDIAGIPDGYEAVYDMPEDHGDEQEDHGVVQEEVQHVDADVADQMMVDNAEPVEWIQVPHDCEVIPVVQNVQPEVQYEPQNGPVLTEGRNGVKYIEINSAKSMPMAGERQEEQAGGNEENVNVLQKQGEQIYSPPASTNFVQDGYGTAGESEENVNVLQEQGEQFYSPSGPTDFAQNDFENVEVY
ncbi:unnamed protein product [Caenorhabditis sp. 36 PRJEB53466]|nr:unnamed protein product [Caenorhabditis sp. 36 PRJEB53466]